jgi:biopolymer transport protein ExbD
MVVPLPEFQFTPMIDCVFLLLCFFVTSQIFATWETEINVQLPTVRTGKIPQRLPGEIIVNILKDGRIIVNKQELDMNALGKLFSRIVSLFPGQAVIIRADRETSYERVISVIDLCRQVDIYNISFATLSEAESAETK